MYFFESLNRKTSKFYHRMFSNDVIYHFGVFGNKINVGDTILYNQMEQVIDKEFGKKQKWYQRNLHHGEITEEEVKLINKISKAVVIGGHGLLMVDSNKNENSGWQFNISVENLKKIEVPIFVLAIGYNVFRNQNDFHPIFKEHISTIISKAKLFAVRNYGSVEAVKKYIPENLHSKVKFHPCPTTVASNYFEHLDATQLSNSKKIGICIAFDRFDNRFGGKHDSIFDILFKYAKTYQNKGYEVEFYAHNRRDITKGPIEIFTNNGFNIKPLYELSEKQVFNYYKSLSLVLGMRGHSLMIPFGMGIPSISLTTQDKQKFFIETTGHMEWNIELEGDFESQLITESDKILNNYTKTKNELKAIQANFIKQTKDNIQEMSKYI